MSSASSQLPVRTLAIRRARRSTEARKFSRVCSSRMFSCPGRGRKRNAVLAITGSPAIVLSDAVGGGILTTHAHRPSSNGQSVGDVDTPPPGRVLLAPGDGNGSGDVVQPLVAPSGLADELGHVQGAWPRNGVVPIGPGEMRPVQERVDDSVAACCGLPKPPA